MQSGIAAILSLQPTDVSIKATTTEKMGFVGREEGLVAYATVLLQKASL
jgi:2-C-methyl-D-erythritol 2,4-cyclodiphosphate synthase